jgi:hypothetical protein
VLLAPCASFAAAPFVIAGSTLTIQIVPERDTFFNTAVHAWIETSARAVTAYYGRFPVPDVEILVRTPRWQGINGGKTFQGRRIEIDAGSKSTGSDFDQDWELMHEFFHLSFPQMDDDDLIWMGEGFSDYLEPLARARLGLMPIKEVWRQLGVGLPKGMPKVHDRGLDHEHSWGRTYWGGALYWFMADVQIRQKTQNRRSIHDVARAILDAGGDGRAEWSIDQVLTVGDHATGTTVLKDLYSEMGNRSYTLDLNHLWGQLGVMDGEWGIQFDDGAPLANIRRAITSD